MKKLCISLLIFCLQTFLITCCDSVAQAPDTTRQIHIIDHMAALAALIAKAAPLPEDHRKLYYKSIGFFASKLTCTDGHYHSTVTLNTPFSSFILPDEPDEDTFCMFVSTNATRDTIQSKRDTALRKSAIIKPVAIFTTENKHQYDYATIGTTHTESSSKCFITINHLDDVTQTKIMHTNPRSRTSFVYHIGNMPTMRPSESMVVPIIPSHPDHDILLKAWKPAESDCAQQTVALWAIAHEPKSELK